jgi:hypothetical protein
MKGTADDAAARSETGEQLPIHGVHRVGAGVSEREHGIELVRWRLFPVRL